MLDSFDDDFRFLREKCISIPERWNLLAELRSVECDSANEAFLISYGVSGADAEK